MELKFLKNNTILKKEKIIFVLHHVRQHIIIPIKNTGTRRSKLEMWLQAQLDKLYPSLEIQYNKKDAITAELDIFIPSLKLAFELNGIFHYEPIFGKEKLKSIKNNDLRKFQACLEQQIELCIIDTSSQKYFKENTSKKYLKIIIEVVNSKLLNS